jgi:hypothetical protein
MICEVAIYCVVRDVLCRCISWRVLSAVLSYAEYAGVFKVVIVTYNTLTKYLYANFKMPFQTFVIKDNLWDVAVEWPATTELKESGSCTVRQPIKGLKTSPE